jgi:tetratricopeptide (TPR) repeat protein
MLDRARWGSDKGVDWIVRLAVGLGAGSWLTRAGVSDLLLSALGGIAIAALPHAVVRRSWPKLHVLLDRHGVAATMLPVGAVTIGMWHATAWNRVPAQAAALWAELSQQPERSLAFYVIALGFLQGYHLRRLTAMAGSTSKFRSAIDSISPRLELALALSLAFAPAPQAAEARSYYTAVCFGLTAHCLMRWWYGVAAARAQLRGVIRGGADAALPVVVKRALRLAERGPIWLAALVLRRHANTLCTTAKLVLAWLWHQLRRTADAIAILEGELRNDGRDAALDPQVHALLHVMHDGRGDLTAARGCLRVAERLDPNCLVAATLNAIKRIESAMSAPAAERSAASLANDAQLITQAYESARRRRPSAISRMVGHACDVTLAFFADARAYAYVALGEYRSAEALFREAFDADSGLASAHVHYAELLLLTLDPAGKSAKQARRDAKTHLYVAIELSGTNTSVGRRASQLLSDLRDRNIKPPSSNPGQNAVPVIG